MPQVTAGGQVFTYGNGERGDKWFYHPDGRCKLAFAAEAEGIYAQGFYDSPDDFEKTDMEVEQEVVEEGNTALEAWTKDMLVDYAFDKFSVKLKKNFSKTNLIKQVEDLENGNSEGLD